MKKFLPVFLALVMLLSMTAVAAASDVVEILYLSSTILETPEGQYEAELIEKFYAEHPGI